MAMGFLFVGLLAASVLCSVFNGTTAALAAAVTSGAQSAVTLSISLAGMLCLWSGIVRVMEVCGLSDGLSKLLRPFLRRLFPQSCRDRQALAAISGNVSANLLGLGNAATPLGIEAVRRMQALSGGTDASDEMCRLIVMNTASIQLIPATVAAVRAGCGAARPFSILPAVWVTSACSVTAGLIAAGLLQRCRKWR